MQEEGARAPSAPSQMRLCLHMRIHAARYCLTMLQDIVGVKDRIKDMITCIRSEREEVSIKNASAHIEVFFGWNDMTICFIRCRHKAKPYPALYSKNTVPLFILFQNVQIILDNPCLFFFCTDRESNIGHPV